MVSYDELPRIRAELEAAKRAEAEARAEEPARLAPLDAVAVPAPYAEPPVSVERPHWQFKPGQSGNPRGRPKGSKNKRRGLAEALLESDAPELARLALDEARAGDKVMLRACLTRAVAPARGRAVRFELPSGRNPERILDALAATQERMTAGIVTPQEARDIAGFLTARLSAYEAWLRTKRLEDRLGLEWVVSQPQDTDEEDEEEEAGPSAEAAATPAPETDKRL